MYQAARAVVPLCHRRPRRHLRQARRLVALHHRPHPQRVPLVPRRRHQRLVQVQP